MFNSLTGILTGKFPQKIFLDTNGIEWEIVVPDTALDKFPSVGEKAKVFVWMQHTDSAMTLFGFATSQDRDLFFDLNKVDGIGPRSAVKIMSSIAREQLVSALDDGNLSMLEKIPGLGKKTAQKMLLALKGKLTLDDSESVVRTVAKSSEFADVVEALVGMGYDRRQVEANVSKIVGELKSTFESKNLTQKEKEDTIFKRAILEFAQ
ncbi:MAG: Holliday junction branch migration protein RuvA [Treponema sp.]|nr:Holliday junction branch migration protein RuvA [Treponema sp.]